MAAVVMRPTKAEQFDFLQLRHQLKDRIRMKKSRGSDAAHGCSVSSTTDDNKKKLPFDNFGFFFGLSEHVMAKKVSEEMKDFVPELKKLASRESRDYSFLQSDGAEIPKPSKGEHEEVGKSKSSSAKSESSSTKQCSMKPMPKQNKPVLKHSIKYRLKEERPEVVIGKARPSLAKSESCSTKQGLKHTKQSVDPKCIAKPMLKLKKSVKDRVTEEQSVDVSSVIQKIFGCNRKRPRDDDDGDDRAMVPTIDDILNEERKSAKIAKEEDERERLLLEKEEKQEEGLRATKKLKLKIKIKVSKN
ncbi:hypothetical protein DVH24_034693 [Malus domestica]|uniref:Uncharacterized protein n=1 Tax=Malus domestica TaxID=3750 RepID=A0A498J1T9_MALDO|nr:hypothetical protein DVH24_034693 [Malus domestica]